MKIKFEAVVEDVFGKWKQAFEYAKNSGDDKLAIKIMEDSWKEGLEIQGLKPLSLKISVVEGEKDG